MSVTALCSWLNVLMCPLLVSMFSRFHPFLVCSSSCFINLQNVFVDYPCHDNQSACQSDFLFPLSGLYSPSWTFIPHSGLGWVALQWYNKQAGPIRGKYQRTKMMFSSFISYNFDFREFYTAKVYEGFLNLNAVGRNTFHCVISSCPFQCGCL